MKKVLTLVVAVVVLSIASIPDVKAASRGDVIDTIRSHFASINKNIGRYKKIKKDAPGYSGEGGTMEAYLDGDSVKKIVLHFYGEMGRTDEDYYFWNDKLIFIFRRESTYDRPLSGKVKSIKENRFYFDDGRMIRWINDKGQQVPSNADGFSEQETENLGSAQEFKEMARS